MLHLLVALVRNLLLTPLLLLRALGRRLSRPPEVVEVRLRGDPPVRPSPWGPLAIDRTPSLEDLDEVLLGAAADRRVTCLLLRIGPLSCGWAKAHALRRLVVRAVDSHKRTVAWLVEPGQLEWLVASPCKEVWLHEACPALLTGVSAEVTFFGEALERIGVAAQMQRVGAYKGAAEVLVQSRPSEEFREALDAVLASLRDDLVDSVARGRGWGRSQALEVLEAGPYHSGEVVDTGLVDRVCTREELPKLLSAGDGEARVGSCGRWLPGPRWTPLARPPAIALISVRGVIRTSDSTRRSLGTAAEEVATQLARAAKSPSIRGVVLHVNSRGGSAVGSDLIWTAVRRVRRDKPVVAWLDERAASGGYYAACCADAVVAAPGTLTGSIGVLAGKVVVAGLLDKLGLHRSLFTTAPRGGMFSASRPFTEEELAFMRDEIGAVYDRFVGRVAEGRGLERDAVEACAQGRVWTGRLARDHGLVDALGTWPDALRLVRERAGIPRGRFRVVRPRPPTPRLAWPKVPGSPASASGSTCAAGLPAEGLSELAWLAGAESPRVVVWAPVWWR